MLTKLIDHFDSLMNIRTCLKDPVRDKFMIPKVPQIRSRFKYLCTSDTSTDSVLLLPQGIQLGLYNCTVLNECCKCWLAGTSQGHRVQPAAWSRAVTDPTGDQPALFSWVLKTAKERDSHLSEQCVQWVGKFLPMSSLNLPTCCCKITSCYCIICLCWEEICSITWAPTHQLSVGVNQCRLIYRCWTRWQVLLKSFLSAS